MTTPTTLESIAQVTTRQPELNDHIVTSWLPISTAWPSSSGCDSYMWKFVPGTLAAWDPGYGLSVQKDLTCLPPQMTSWWDAIYLPVTADLASTQYSIGPIVCPDAYTTATTFVNAGSSTIVACCPSQYKFNGTFNVGETGQCASELEVGQVVEYVTRDKSSKWVTTTSTVDEASHAYGIQMNGWLFPEEPTSSISSKETLASSTSTPGPEPENSGLSTGAKAGIGVGVGLGAIILVAVFALLLRRRQSRKKNTTSQDVAVDDKGAYTDVPPSEMYASSSIPSELRGSSPQDHTNAIELSVQGKPVELP